MGMAAANFHDLQRADRQGLRSRGVRRSISCNRNLRLGADREIRRHISCRRSLSRQLAAIVGEQRVHKIPQDVIGGDVAFLHAVDRIVGTTRQ